MKLKQSLWVAGLVAAVGLAACTALAQGEGGGNGGGRRAGGGGGGFGGGNFDPAEFQRQMMENIRDQMSVTNDDEWKVIETRVQKVMDARRDVGVGGGLGRLFGRGRGGGGNDGGGGGGGGRRGGFFGGTPMPEQEALNSAIENKAPTKQIEAALEKYRAARKAREAALEKSQADLKNVLSVRQEAVAVSLGLLN